MEEGYENVARVVGSAGDSKFVINQGSDHEIQVGERFLIFRLGDRIIDPETEEDLGVLEIVLGRARVTHVQKKMCTLESTEEETIPGKIRKIKNPWSLYSREEEVEEGRKVRSVPIRFQIGDLARPV